MSDELKSQVVAAVEEYAAGGTAATLFEALKRLFAMAQNISPDEAKAISAKIVEIGALFAAGQVWAAAFAVMALAQMIITAAAS